jgi:hypothetical protein
MSKIAYHKMCRHHEAVARAKRMLNKIEKRFGGFQGEFYCNIQLTGIADIDGREVNSYVTRHLTELKKKIEHQLEKNEKWVNGEWNEQYEEGYYTPPLLEQFEIFEALKVVYSFIRSGYPEIEIKKSEVFVLTAQTPEAKYHEVLKFYRSKPVDGFNQEIFAVLENDEIKKLYPITFSVYDLTTVKSVFIEFQ